MQKIRIGPGYYKPKWMDEIEAFNKKSCRGMLDSLSDRFPEYVLNNNPGIYENYLIFSLLAMFFCIV